MQLVINNCIFLMVNHSSYRVLAPSFDESASPSEIPRAAPDESKRLLGEGNEVKLVEGEFERKQVIARAGGWQI